jgi:hypothetical protein
MMMERKNGQQGQRPKKAIQAAACPALPLHTSNDHPPTPTPTPAQGRPSFQALPTHGLRLSWAMLCLLGSLSPWLVSQTLGCQKEEDLSHMLQGSGLSTLTLRLARGVGRMEALVIPPSSTFWPPLLGTNQKTRSPCP